VPWDTAPGLIGDDVPAADAIVSLFRILAQPEAPGVFIRAPKPKDPLWVSMQYWYPLVHMLRYSLGWARLDKGLWWWFEQGKPRTDPRLRILSDLYDADGLLDGFCAWLWSGGAGVPGSDGFEQFGWTDAGDRVPAKPNWVTSTLSAVRESGQPAGHGDYGVLHLVGHAQIPLNGRNRPFQLLHSNVTERRAIVVFENLVGWYHGLNDVQSSLPKLDNQSWYLDVVVKPVGWMGTYRRSRSTGIWFSGQHRFHTPGT
jgi:hypothetical protein